MTFSVPNLYFESNLLKGLELIWFEELFWVTPYGIDPGYFGWIHSIHAEEKVMEKSKMVSTTAENYVQTSAFEDIDKIAMTFGKM